MRELSAAELDRIADAVASRIVEKIEPLLDRRGPRRGEGAHVSDSVTLEKMGGRRRRGAR